MPSRVHTATLTTIVVCMPMMLWACGVDTAETSRQSGLDAVDEQIEQAAQPLVSVAGSGCADGTREAFTAYPGATIAGCSGGWTVPGIMLDNPGHAPSCPSIVTRDTVTPACGRNAGNSGANPNGVGCNVADLCAPGWHVCQTALEVARNSPTGDCSSALTGSDSTPLFFATRQSSDGCLVCATGNSTGPQCNSATCQAGCQQTQYLSNDLFGCGNVGSSVGPSCGGLDRSSNDGCSALGGSWSCTDDGSGHCEAYVVKHADSATGGVLCCQDATVCTTIQRCQGGTAADAVIAPGAYANTAFPTTPRLWVGNSGAVPGNKSLLWFDLNGIPTTATVTSAKLMLKSPAVLNASPADAVDVYQVLSSSSWWTAPTGTLTWNAFGGTLAGVTTSISLISGVPRVISLPATLVQGWVTSPSSNDGLALALDPGSNQAAGEAFRSSDWPKCTDQPALQVCYTP
jgi:hypothetical protein